MIHCMVDVFLQALNNVIGIELKIVYQETMFFCDL